MPQSSPAYIMLSMLSGGLWGATAYLIGHRWMMPFLWGGIVLSPFIGLLIGKLSIPVYQQGFRAIVSWSLISLYLAVFMFGIVTGLTDAMRLLPQRNFVAVILQSVLGTMAGATGYILVLLPLSLMNHALLRWAARRLACVK